MPFPADDYTPHGYLGTPTHTRNLSPRGVLRSWGAGFRWHFPAHAGIYGGRREIYRAGFRLALDGALEIADFARALSPYHSCNVFTFELARGAARCRATFFLAGEHALCAALEVSGARRLAVLLEYTRLLAANGEWGESGLVGRLAEGELALQGFEDGEAFALWVSPPPLDLGVTPDVAEAARWAVATAPGLPPEGFRAVTGRMGETVALHGVLGLQIPVDGTIQVVLARGRTLRQAQHRLRTARRTAEAERERKVAEDEVFWARAPRLAGDWPDHWRRGLVYDLETVRMMVRAPVGIYRHVWDAMQIQAPRMVLAEAAIDALLLSYANARAAQDLLLGTFLDAPEPNVPCSREDGSYNMVAADGTVCGTAPPWGYPWLVLQWLAALRPDRAWLDRIYPHLADYLDWWLASRRDAEGWLHYACSWESGQDDSPRFGEQPLGGGHPVCHVRPVDLHAAFAHACAAMAGFAQALGRSADIARWEDLARECAGRTEALWTGDERPTTNDQRPTIGAEGAHSGESIPEAFVVRRSSFVGGRYADFDARAGRPTDVDDVMLLAPLALGLAPAERAAALIPALQALDPEALTWPMFVWTAVEAAGRAGLHERAAELAAAVVERAYGFWDARQAHPERTLPGVACEYWPPGGRCGGEGYGWGAFTTHLVLHTLAGIAPAEGGLLLRPNLPPAWRVPGRSYRVLLHWGRIPLEVVLAPLEGGRVAVSAGGRQAELAWGEEVRLTPGAAGE
ncbi:MAG TPA: hypothetical protein VNL77_19930 [Roseiflexaceae bacterium]|nr:hypothetical protein [Roseiflexaceae bacterium]